MNMQKFAYERYKLDWMFKHGYTFVDLIEGLNEVYSDSLHVGSIQQLFKVWESDCGFNSEIWACFDEFIENEYKDTGYMKTLLNYSNFKNYLKNIKQ